MPPALRQSPALRARRNTALYRSLARTLREYNRRLVAALRARGFADFSPAFPPMLSNLDLSGTPIGVLARRVGVSRQAAGQLLAEIERCGYARRTPSPVDARVTIVRFSPRGQRLLATVIELVGAIEGEFAAALPAGEYERLQRGLLAIADAIDPAGVLGEGDLPLAADAPATPRPSARRASRRGQSPAAR